MTKEIYLFRHGYSQANAERYRKVLFPKLLMLARKWFGFAVTARIVRFLDGLRGYNNQYPRVDSDIPLVALGVEQAGFTRKFLAKKNILPDLILCSDFLRTRQTANGILKGIELEIGKALNHMVLYSKLIVERDGGDEFGYPLSYYPVLFPETNDYYHRSPKLDFRPPGGESIRDVRFNRIPELKNILASLQFKTLFIVGHGITNSAIISLLTNDDLESIRIGSPNLGVYRFTAEEGSDKWKLDPDYIKGKTIDPSIPISG